MAAPAPLARAAVPFTRAAAPIALVAAFLVVVLLLSLAGCGGASVTSTSAPAATATTTPTAIAPTTTTAAATTTSAGSAFPVTLADDASNTVTVGALPQRIVSTVPANTETLFALGAGPRVVGVSSMDDYPPEALSLPKVGNFELSTEAVVALDPDLVVAWVGNADALKIVKDKGVPVLLFAPESVAAVYRNIETVGAAVGEQQTAQKLVQDLQIEIDGIANSAGLLGDSPKVFYALDNTLWTVGPGSFVNELIGLAGGVNVAAGGPKPFFQYTPEQLVATDPDMILLPNTAFKSAEEFTKDPRFANLRAVKEGKVVVVNDTIITRPGPRIAEGLKSLAGSIHPGVTF